MTTRFSLAVALLALGMAACGERPVEPGHKSLCQAAPLGKTYNMVNPHFAGYIHGIIAAAVIHHEPFDTFKTGNLAGKTFERNR